VFQNDAINRFTTTVLAYHLKNRGLKAHALAGGHDGGNLA
jgi:hypothetical protein